jgi:hypothetical protein
LSRLVGDLDLGNHVDWIVAINRIQNDGIWICAWDESYLRGDFNLNNGANWEREGQVKSEGVGVLSIYVA